MKDKYVYVIYDPLYEKVVCVHDEPDKLCDKCQSIERDGAYYLEESEHLVEKKLKDTNNKIK